jgi:hypothetical protein
MRNFGAFITVSCLTGVIVAVGCSSSSSSTSTTAGAGGKPATSSTPTSSTASSTVTTGNGGAGGTGGSGGAGGGTGGSISLDCTLPATPPSAGSCVPFMADAGTPEEDSGANDAGHVTTTTCNPITNEGCTGTDVCGVDDDGQNYFCQPAGSPAAVACGGDCSNTASCGVGGLCVQFSNGDSCVQMCCSNADCGSGMCVMTGFLETDLGYGVGLCISN